MFDTHKTIRLVVKKLYVKIFDTHKAIRRRCGEETTFIWLRGVAMKKLYVKMFDTHKLYGDGVAKKRYVYTATRCGDEETVR